MMKKLIFGLFAVASFVACSNKVLDDYISPTPIGFGNVATRAVVGSADDILSFGVYAQMNLGANDTDKATEWISLLGNECISRTDKDSAWTYSNTRYWVDDRTFRFFGYWPYLTDEKSTESTGLLSIAETAPVSGEYEMSFVTPDAADADLLTARELAVTTESQEDYPTVDLNFKHELTKVSFKVWRDNVNHKNDKMYIKSFKLTGVKKSGTLTTSILTNATSSWALGSDTMDFTRNDYTEDTNGLYAELGDADTSSGTIVSGDILNSVIYDNGLLLIPQELTDCKIEMEYQIYRSYDENEFDSTKIENKTLEIELANQSPWTAGKNITYNIVLSDVKNIQFYYIQTTISAWGAPQTGGTVIIK